MPLTGDVAVIIPAKNEADRIPATESGRPDPEDGDAIDRLAFWVTTRRLGIRTVAADCGDVVPGAHQGGADVA